MHSVLNYFYVLLIFFSWQVKISNFLVKSKGKGVILKLSPIPWKGRSILAGKVQVRVLHSHYLAKSCLHYASLIEKGRCQRTKSAEVTFN